MNKEDMFELLNDESFTLFITEHSVISTGYNTLFTIHSNDSSTLKYLNSNGFPVVYSDTDGFIIVKF